MTARTHGVLYSSDLCTTIMLVAPVTKNYTSEIEKLTPSGQNTRQIHLSNTSWMATIMLFLNHVARKSSKRFLTWSC